MGLCLAKTPISKGCPQKRTQIKSNQVDGCVVFNQSCSRSRKRKVKNPSRPLTKKEVFVCFGWSLNKVSCLSLINAIYYTYLSQANSRDLPKGQNFGFDRNTERKLRALFGRKTLFRPKVAVSALYFCQKCDRNRLLSAETGSLGRSSPYRPKFFLLANVRFQPKLLFSLCFGRNTRLISTKSDIYPDGT